MNIKCVMFGHKLQKNFETLSYKCLRCKITITHESLEEANRGHRNREADSESRARALPAGTPGERAGGAEPAAGAGTCACGKKLIAMAGGSWCLDCTLAAYKMKSTPQALEPVSKEIIAWRGWRLVKYADGWKLHSVTQHLVCWDGPTLIADKVPEWNSQHGIYALTERNAVVGNGYQGHCLGEVALSGVVVEGSNGYRAERAMIRSLTLLGYFDPSTRPIEIMADLEERYQCEVSWEMETPYMLAWTLLQSSAYTQALSQQYYSQQSTLMHMGGIGGYLGNAAGISNLLGP